LRRAAEKYFEEYKTLGLPYTIGKLCSHTGVLTRQALVRYHSIPEFRDTVDWIRAECEADQEARLVNKDTFTPGLVFSLKNNSGWVDKTEVDETHKYPTGIDVTFVKVKRDDTQTGQDKPVHPAD
jgi:hypothetical protein